MPVLVIFFALSGTSCQKLTRVVSFDQNFAPEVNVQTSEQDGATSGTVYSTSRSAQRVTVAAGKGIDGASVIFPVSSLSATATVTITKGEDLATTELVAALGLTSFPSKANAVKITSSPQMDTLQPMEIRIPAPAASALSLLLGGDSNWVVLFESLHAGEGATHWSGVIPRSDFTIENGYAKISAKYFGTYQVVETDPLIATADSRQGTMAEIASQKAAETKANENAPTASLSGAPTGTSDLVTLDVTIGGDGVTEYQYDLVSGADCTSASYGAWTAVATHITESTGANGQKTLCVLGRGANGKTQEAPTTASWTKDIVATLSGAPTGTNNATTLDVTVAGNSITEYQYDLVSGTDCTSASYGTWTAVATHITEAPGSDGAKILCVIGRDSGGNPQTTATTAAWTKDTAAPTATLTGAPTGTNNATTLNVTVGGTGVTEYQYDLVSGTDCTSASYGAWTAVATHITEAPGADGAKILCVIGRDAATNAQATATTASWTKDTVAPTAALTGAPTGTNSATTLDVTVGGTGVTEYQYDLVSGTDCTSASYGAWTAVATHITEAPGTDGSKILCVIGRDAATNAQTTATTAAWTKDTVAPTISITHPAANAYANASDYTSFAVGGACDTAGITISISTPVAATTTCSTGIWSANLSLSTVTDGAFTVTINASDSAGNNAAQQTRSFNKDIVAPTATLTGAPTGTNNATTMDVTVGGTGVTEYKYDLVDGVSCANASYGSWTAVATHITEAPGADGSKILCVIGRDAATNAQTTATTASWTKAPVAATPTFGVSAGTYHSAQTVTLSTTTAGATIRYTTDGSTPTTSSTAYNSAISVPSSQTIRAFTQKSGYIDSAEASAAYVINVITPVAVEAFPSTLNYPTVTWTPNVKFTLGSGTTIGLYSDTSGTGINTPASASAGSNTMVANTVTSLGTSASIYAKDPAATGYVSMGSYTTKLPPSFAALGAFSSSSGGTIQAIVKDSVSTGCTTAPNCLYVGGTFTAFQHVAANYIIKIMPDGSLSTLGSGLDGPVRALALDTSGNLYVGGMFLSAGGVVNTSRIAKWNGSSWSALGTGTTGIVNALAVHGSNLYVGGAFPSASGVANTAKIAKWDTGTSTWSSLTSATGITEVYALGVDESGNLYMGGSFINLNAILDADGIAKWDGASWSALGTGVASGQVYTLAVSGSDVYIGGPFTSVGGVANTNYIAKWSGTAWSALGTGTNNFTYSIAVSGTSVYAGGWFTAAGGNSAMNIAKWDGSAWVALGSGLGTINSTVQALALDGFGNLSAGGNFTTTGGSEANYFAKWNGSTWSAQGSASAINGGSILTIATSENNIYAGGSFKTAGVSNSAYIAKWNGTAWSALGTGMNNFVYALATDFSGNVYAGGSFNTAGGTPANKIAMWNGSSWSPLGTGMDNNVNALAISGSILYVGGSFTTASGSPANYIAKWDGSSWSTLGSGMNGAVNALAVDSLGNLYAAGAFSSAGGIAASRIAKWDPTANAGIGAWSALGSGTNNIVRALAVDWSGNVYAGGTFSLAGSVSASYIAKWNGSVWSALGSGVGNQVNAITVSGSTILVGGMFTTAGGSPAQYIAKWNGSAWSIPGGAGTNEGVYALATDSSGNIYAGGYFATAGGLVRPAIAKFMTLFDAWF